MLPCLGALRLGHMATVLLGATIIRSVLVPASMQWLGRYHGRVPSFLTWLPRINVEGAHAAPAGAACDD